jgi:hypothetical protein
MSSAYMLGQSTYLCNNKKVGTLVEPVPVPKSWKMELLWLRNQNAKPFLGLPGNFELLSLLATHKKSNLQNLKQIKL